MTNNLSKVFEEVISIDAWHACFDNDGVSSVHVDLSFRTSFVGGEDESDITFELSLRRAELKIVVPSTEGISVIQSSVDREPTLEGVKKVILESQIGGAGQATISTQLRGNFPISAGGKVEVSGAKSKKSTTEFISKTSEFDIRQIIDRSRNYGWEITATNGGMLSGKVWDPVKRPRLKIKKHAKSRLDPGFRIVVSCKLGDMIVDKIKSKSKKILRGKFFENREAAAKALIKHKIAELGLRTPAGDHDFVDIVIGECAVTQEVV